MRRHAWLSLALLAHLVACGSDLEVTGSVVEIPFLAQIDPCALVGNLRQNMEAILEIGGNYDPCALTVNSTDLSARGQCPGIATRLVRPLGLGYWLPNPLAPPTRVPLAFIIGWVDLRPDSLDPEASSVTVVLDPSTPDVVQVDTDAELDALPETADCVNLTVLNELESCEAQSAFKEEFVADELTFDYEPAGPGDGTANIREACDGTLFQ